MYDDKTLREKIQKHAEEKDILVNPNEKITNVVISGLIRNDEALGEIYCPCRRPSGDKEKDKAIICPCVYHMDEIKDMGHCHCLLFVNSEFAKKVEDNK